MHSFYDRSSSFVQRSSGRFRKISLAEATMRAIGIRVKTLPIDPGLAFADALKVDVANLRSFGFRPALEPRSVPALAEFSRALDPDAESYADAIKTVMTQAISRAADSLVEVFVKSQRPRIIDGLTKVFGLFADSPPNVADRYDLAGPPLGYSNGYEDLRHTTLRGVPRMTLAVNRIAEELAQMADEISFSYRRALFPLLASSGPAPKRSYPYIDRTEAEYSGFNGVLAIQRTREIIADALEADKRWLRQLGQFWPTEDMEFVKRMRPLVEADLRLLAEGGTDALPERSLLRWLSQGHSPMHPPARTPNAHDSLLSYLRERASLIGSQAMYGADSVFAEGVMILFDASATRSPVTTRAGAVPHGILVSIA